MRSSGILLPVFSLPGKYGMGCFSKHAYRFIDKLAGAGQKYWQILPLGHAGGWYSPYQPLSCFAVDPAFIDPETLFEKGLVTENDLKELDEATEQFPADKINYDEIIPLRMQLLRKAHSTFSGITGKENADRGDYNRFCRENNYWLDDYALFISLSKYHDDTDWSHWKKEYKKRSKDALAAYAKEHSGDMDLYRWMQYEAYSQWQNIKKYANERGVEIIGDIPIYSAYESSDCWAHPELFKLTASLRPQAVAGCPPDGFSDTGQVWGNPLYKWSRHKETGYEWWIGRLRQNFRLCDVIRLDHMRGFESFFSIPAKDETAENGRWMRGPGMHLFRKVSEELPNARFIAEDLGTITPKVNKLIKDTGFPGMKVLQFAFDGNMDNPYLPENYTENCVVYTGTHDNDTTVGWYNSLDMDIRRTVTSFIRSQSGRQPDSHFKAPVFDAGTAARSMVSIAMRSRAETCIIPVQDHLLLGSEARVNVPGTTGDNWTWRMREGMMDDDIISYIKMLTRESGRTSD